jgi:hypothetical protein
MSNKVNIAKNMSSGDCNLKCNYRFDYPKGEPLIVENTRNDGLVIDYAQSRPKIAPVRYNGNHYDVRSTRITAPWGEFKIRNKFPNGMITIIHEPRVEGNRLIVMVPLETGGTNNAGGLVSDIMKAGMRQIPEKGDKTTLNLSNNSLNIIVPKQPFFSFQTAKGGVDYIIFERGASINRKLLWEYQRFVFGKTFSRNANKFIRNVQNAKPKMFTQTDGKLFYNKDGAKGLTNGDGSDDVYIVCEPTDQADDNVFVKMEDYAQQMGFDFFSDGSSDVLKNPWVQAFILFIGILLLYAIIFKLMRYLKPVNADIKTGMSGVFERRVQ